MHFTKLMFFCATIWLIHSLLSNNQSISLFEQKYKNGKYNFDLLPTFKTSQLLILKQYFQCLLSVWIFILLTCSYRRFLLLTARGALHIAPNTLVHVKHQVRTSLAIDELLLTYLETVGSSVTRTRTKDKRHCLFKQKNEH